MVFLVEIIRIYFVSIGSIVLVSRVTKGFVIVICHNIKECTSVKMHTFQVSHLNTVLRLNKCVLVKSNIKLRHYIIQFYFW